MKRIIASLILCLLAGVPGFAEVVKVKGKGEVVYKGLFKQGSEDERVAILEAKKSALARYAAGLESSRFELYKKIEPEVLAHVDDYIIDYTQIDQQVDKTSKRFSVIIEASVNTSLIESTIQKSTAAPPGGGEEQSFITFVFVARELASRKVFDAKRTTVEINEASRSNSEKDSAGADGQSADSSLETGSVAKKTTGGNTELKADVLAYRVSTATEVDNAVNAVLTKARYESVDPTDAGLDIELFKNDFSSGSDISPATRTAAIKTLKEKGIGFMAVANMDVGLPEKDEVSGQIRVYVTVTAKVTALAAKFPKTVASIAGKPFAGLGPNAQVARQNALNEAATQSAIELTDQLRSKSIR
jgi:hypothetical protein